MLLLERMGMDMPSPDENQNVSWRLAAVGSDCLTLVASVAEPHENEAVPCGAGRRECAPVHAGAIRRQRRGCCSAGSAPHRRNQRWRTSTIDLRTKMSEAHARACNVQATVGQTDRRQHNTFDSLDQYFDSFDLNEIDLEYASNCNLQKSSQSSAARRLFPASLALDGRTCWDRDHIFDQGACRPATLMDGVPDDMRRDLAQ